MGVFKTVPLITNGSATGAAAGWPGGRGVVMGEGTWGGGSIALQMQTDNGTWIGVDGTNAVLSANGAFGFELPPCAIRAAVTGSPSALYVIAKATDAP